MRDAQNPGIIRYIPDEELWKEACAVAYEELNTPKSLALAIMLRYGEYLQLAEMKIDPSDYNSKDSFQKDWIAVELLRKFDGLPGLTPALRKKAALEKAASAEQACAETNRRLLDFTLGSGFPAGVESILSEAKRKIRRVLGKYHLTEHLGKCRWGPGSDALNRRPYVSSYHKFFGNLSATKAVMPFISSFLESNHLWGTWLCAAEPLGPFSPRVQFFKGNGLSTVPKTALTDRSICIEPSLNVFLQLGLGSVIRSRLKRNGIDLDSQELNRMLALQFSEENTGATIDLSSASDTVARRLIQILFSDDPDLSVWLRVMEALRSPFTNWGSKKRPDWRLNHKFSSMGNGFTFELETLVFWALASASAEQVGGKCLTVYGDDIIVTSDAYPRVTEVLSHFGFSVNTRKSFATGYFRESCGMNAWDGYEIPSYRLETLNDISDTFSFHNGLVRCGLKRAASRVLRKIPSFLRFFGPSGAGDVVLHNSDYASWKVKPHGLIDQWFFWAGELKSLKFVPLEQRAKHYEPAILHSFSSMRPSSDIPLWGARWGTEGVVTLSEGYWTVGRSLVSREHLGLLAQEAP